jgi:hypothetical protein
LDQLVDERPDMYALRVRHYGEAPALRAGTGSVLAVLPAPTAAPPWAGRCSPEQLKRRPLRSARVPTAEPRLELDGVVVEIRATPSAAAA